MCKYGLEVQFRDAKLAVRRAERDSEWELEQWVRAPVEGLISDIRITGVATKGVGLEVVLLEREDRNVQLAE